MKFKKRNHLLKRIFVYLILITLFVMPLTIISINPMDSSFFRDKQVNKNYELNDKPKLSAGEIVIKTPENKSYANPMSGYYPATYGFENEADGGYTPSGWNLIQATGMVEIYGELDGHKKVFGLYDNNSWERRTIQTFIAGPQSIGTIEFYIRSDDVSQDQCYVPYYNFVFGSIYQYPFYLQFNNNKIQFWNGSFYDILDSAKNNTWYHVRFDFRMSGAGEYLGLGDNSVRVYLNSTDLGIYQCNNTYSSIKEFQMLSSGSSEEIHVYIDALGYSWDPNYNVGDNLKEGLLLSYDTSVSLTWKGYSLDGAANKTINGNTTISMPENGNHKIQIFGNNNLGTKYQSDIRYFRTGALFINSPENKTYNNADKGYYPATYGFENDAIGSDPKGWICINDVDVVTSNDGHNKVVELVNEQGSGNAARMDHSFNEQISGTIEFWLRYNNDGGEDAFYIELNNGGIQSVYIYYEPSIPAWKYIAGDDPFERLDIPNIAPINDGKWHHIRIDFECGNEQYEGLDQYTWKMQLDGVSSGQCIFHKIANNITVLQLITQEEDPTGYKYYIDAVGYSWDPNYIIGDNLKEGLLLNFDNSTNLDWMGYSLDGAANKTIFLSCTIPMPANGVHSILFFYNDTYGNMYQSDLIWFTVNMASEEQIPVDGGDGNDDSSSKKSITLQYDLGFIIIIIIIASIVAIAIPTIYIKQSKNKKKKEKLTTTKDELEKPVEYIKKTIEYTEYTEGPAKLPKAIEVKESFEIVDKKKKTKLVKEIKIDKEKWEKEVAKTEKELLIDKQIDRCIVHRGPIKGMNYICPQCQTKYCLNCVKTLAKRGEKCWVCNAELSIDISEEQQYGKTTIPTGKDGEKLKGKSDEIKKPDETEVIDISDIINKEVIINMLGIRGKDTNDIDALLKKIFKNKDTRKHIRSEINRMPEGTFNDFIKSYERIKKQLAEEKPEVDLDNDNYFNERKGK